MNYLSNIKCVNRGNGVALNTHKKLEDARQYLFEDAEAATHDNTGGREGSKYYITTDDDQRRIVEVWMITGKGTLEYQSDYVQALPRYGR